jgi:aspartyl-tRNA(Asn)/glutamyl-tRNA(Gln) amidotransferase subunit A
VTQDSVRTTISGLAEVSGRIRRREVSATQLAEQALARIRTLDPLLNAFITVMADQALAAAAQADREIADGAYRGPLHGVPLSVKDLFWTAGVRTTAGSRVLADFVPTEDATLVARVRQAGGVIVGKTNMLEFAYASFHPDYGPTRNPWNLERTALGSSGGSGAEVAAGLDFGSYGSDTGGSIRVPSSFCGASGLKPTYGRVSRYGVVPLSPTLDHVGPMARSVEDLALLLQPIVGPDSKDPTAATAEVVDYAASLNGSLKGVSAALVRNFLGSNATEQVRAAVELAAQVLTDAGASLTEIEIPELGDTAIDTYLAILFPEASYCHRDWLIDRRSDYSAGVLERLDDGTEIGAVAYLAARDQRERIQASLREHQQSVDLLVMPTTAMPAWPIEATDIPVGEEEEDLKSIIRFTSPFDLTGQPALSVPCGFTDNGLPIGLQIVGRPFDEALVLRAGHAYQSATDWHRRPPAHSVATISEEVDGVSAGS